MTPMRIQRKRVKGWRLPPNTVCVSRPGRFGNPFDWMSFGKARAVNLFGRWIGGNIMFTESQNLRLDAPWLDAQPDAARDFIRGEATLRLRGKNLACWCRLCPAHADGKPLGVKCKHCDPCHADFLLRLANTKAAP